MSITWPWLHWIQARRKAEEAARELERSRERLASAEQKVVPLVIIDHTNQFAEKIRQALQLGYEKPPARHPKENPGR